MHLKPMGNDMFHKGTLKTYDSDSKIGTIYLPDIALELHFSVEDLPNPSIPPQIGERVKCFINEDEEDAKDKAKFIVRLDHKNSRTEKPLNRIFYSEEEDLKALKERERLKAEEARALEQWQREVEEEVRTRVELEVEQAKKELIQHIQEHVPDLDADQKAQPLDVQATDPQSVDSKSLDQDQPDQQSHVQQGATATALEAVDSTKPFIHSAIEEAFDAGSSSSHSENLHQVDSTPTLMHSNGSAAPAITNLQKNELPEIDDVLVVSSDFIAPNIKFNLDIHQDTNTSFKFADSSVSDVDALNTTEQPKSEPDSSSVFHLDLGKAEKIELDRVKLNPQPAKELNSALNIPLAPKLSALMDEVPLQSAQTSQQQAWQNQEQRLDSYPHTPSLEAQSAESFTSHQQGAFAHDNAQAKSSVLNKLKTKIEYQTHTPVKAQRKPSKDINLWPIIMLIGVLSLIGAGYVGYVKYQQHVQEREAKAKLYLLEQQRLIEEQRKRLGKLPDKKVLSDKSLDELLGKDRTK